MAGVVKELEVEVHVEVEHWPIFDHKISSLSTASGFCRYRDIFYLQKAIKGCSPATQTTESMKAT